MAKNRWRLVFIWFRWICKAFSMAARWRSLVLLKSWFQNG